MIENIFTATPAEIDTEIANLEGQNAALHAAADRAHRTIEYKYSTDAEREQARKTIGDAMTRSSVLNHLLHGLEAEYVRRGGWARVYAVNNSNGHFHRSTACRNTYVTTAWIWMPELSGLTNAEVVERTSKMSCLTCFADQREEIEKGREATVFTPVQAKAREEREAAAAAKAAKQAKATANAVYGEDGEILQLPDYFGEMKPVKSEIACNRLVMQAATDLAFYGTHPDEETWKLTIELGLKALARKRGTTVEHERALVDAKVAKKIAKM